MSASGNLPSRGRRYPEPENPTSRRNFVSDERRGYRDVAPAPPTRYTHYDFTNYFDLNGGAKQPSRKRLNDSPAPRGGCQERKEEKDSFCDPSGFKCLECSTWNYTGQEECWRCGVCAKDSAKKRPPGSESRLLNNKQTKDVQQTLSPDNGGFENTEETMDEFGRQPIKRKKKEWPPCFDTKGADYVLDSRSGMFYHADTQFFFDPHTKLYYGSQQASYYRHDAQRKTFIEVQGMGEEIAEQGYSKDFSFFEPVSAVLASSKSTSKPSGISVNLKTKRLPKSKSSKSSPSLAFATCTAGSASANHSLQQHDKDINKWVERQDEMRQQEQRAPNASAKNVDIERTTKGEPICRLCQRKFPSVEKLEYHVRASQLHAENLKKHKDLASSGSTTRPGTEYVDRAHQRRVMNGASALPVVLPKLEDATSAQPPGQCAVDKTLGTNNVGNQILQKLGWKSGSAIGRRSGPGSKDAASELKREWERIEAMSLNQKTGQL